MIALWGEWGFGLNAASYAAVLAALAVMRVAPRMPEQAGAGLLTQLAAGFRWAYGFLPSRSMLLLLAAVTAGVHQRRDGLSNRPGNEEPAAATGCPCRGLFFGLRWDGLET